MEAELAEWCRSMGLTASRVLQHRASRLTVQAVDRHGGLYVLKTATSAGDLNGDVAGIRTLAAAGLPVPTIVEHHDGSRPVLLLSWIEGESLTSDSPAEAVRETATLLRRVHLLPAGPPFSGRPTIADWIFSWTEEILRWWPTAGASARSVSRMSDWCHDLAPNLGRRRGCLTLFDGRAEHFLIHRGQLVGVVDLHDVGAGDPAMDLATLGLTDDALLAAVLGSYGSTGEDDDLLELIPYFVLLRRLAGAEWHFRTGSSTEAQKLLDLADAALR